NARASANYDKNQSSSNSAGDKLSQATSSKDVTIEFAGPQAKDFDEFAKLVPNLPESWYLLDRGPAEAMVPVWSFVTVNLFGEEIATRVAPLLQRAWSEEAIRFNDIDIIKGLIDRASHEAEDSVRAAIRSQLNGLSVLNLDTTPERKLDASVKKLLTMIDEYERDFGISILADLLRDHQLPRVLGHFAPSENPRFKSALTTLGEYFDPHRLLKLQLEIPSITLDDHVRCKLDAAAGRKPRESNASDGWRPTPAQLREIPSSINEIVDGVSSLDAGGEKLLTQRLGEIPPSINAIAHSRLGEFWAVTMAELHKRSMKDNDRDILHRIEDLASKLQWSSNEERFTRTLNERQVHLFAHVIEIILAPKTSSATVKSAKEDPVWRSTFFVDVDRGGKKSISHVQTNRVISSASSVLDTILDTLVHRQDVRGALYPNVVVNDDDDDEDYVDSSDEEADSPREDTDRHVDRTNVVPGVYDTSLKLLSSLNVAARATVMKLLLERRFLVPVVSPNGDAMQWDVDPPHGPLRALRATCDLRVLCACVPCCVLPASWLFVCRVCLRLCCLLLRATSIEAQSSPAISQSYQVRSLQPLRTPLQPPYPLSKPPVCVQDSPCVLRTPACGSANSTPSRIKYQNKFFVV
ncbi:hypothetical protein LEN26_004833, partial [Aphanomyces euteiches]